MNKVVIFGNSGAGKSTLAKQYVEQLNLPHLDLDTLAWQDTRPPVRKALQESEQGINAFIENHSSWVIEGCYADLLALVTDSASELVFLNPGIETCLDNCINRPWEPHKYASAEEQNENLDMLLDWVKQYPLRTDEFSLSSHRSLFKQFTGKKTEYNSLHSL